ncbi:hypothetical protein TNCV_4525311 [Trichonephila clavipes]|nr:hypothetical protein TNCV_4525311 [Trichonephila clavipes]
MQVLLMHYGCWQFIIQTKPGQPDEEATYKEKLDLQLHGKKRTSRVVKIEAELILEANRLQLMKQDLEKAENAYLSSFTSKKSKTLPGATAAAHGDPNGKNDYQKKGDLKPITNMKMSLATEDKSCPVEGIGTLRFRVKYKGSFHEITLSDVLFNPKLRRNLLSGSRLESKGAHFVGTKDENKLVETINLRYIFDENKRGINFRQKVNSNLGYNLNLPDYYDDEDDFDRVKDSLTSRLVSKTSTETPSTSEKPDVSSDNHSLIPCTEVKWIRNIGRKVTGSNVYYSIGGEATRLKSFNEIERYYKRHNIEYDPSLFNFRKDNIPNPRDFQICQSNKKLLWLK